MMYQNSFSMLSFGWHLHMTFVVLAVFGGVLLSIWAVKNMSKSNLLKFSIWVLVIGVLGFMLTANWGTRGWTYMMGGNSCPMMHWGLDEREDFDSPEEFREHMFEKMEEHMGF